MQKSSHTRIIGILVWVLSVLPRTNVECVRRLPNVNPVVPGVDPSLVELELVGWWCVPILKCLRVVVVSVVL